MKTRFSLLVDRIQFIGILLATMLVPLIFYIGNQNIVIFKPLLAQFIMYVLLALWFIDSLEKNEFSLPSTALNGPIVAYMLWLVGTILLSSFFWFYSLEEMGRYLAVFLLFFLIQKTVRNRFRLRWVLWVFFGTCIVGTGWGLIQHLHQLGIVEKTIINWGREVIVSTFGNKNFFAGFLTMTSPVVFAYALATKKQGVKWTLFGLFGAQFYILMATGTRTGFLGFWIGMFVFIFLLFRFIWLREELSDQVRKKRFVRFAAVFIFMLGFSYLFVPDHLIRRLGEAFDLQQGTQRVRWIMWTGSSRAAMDQPVTGHGHGTFQLVFPNYRPSFYHRFRVSHNTRHSHNEYLEVLMETGLVGLSLFLLLFVVLGVVTYRFIRRCKSRFYILLVIGLVSGVVAGLAQNFASVNLRWMSSTFIFWLLVSLIFAVFRVACHRNENANTRTIQRSFGLLPRLSWRTPIYGVLIGIVFLVGFGFYQLVQADFSLKNLNQYIQLAEADRVSWDETMNVGREALEFSPFSLSTRYKLGYTYLQAQEFERAYRQYDTLTDMAPNYAQIHNNIALIHRRFGDDFRSLLHFEWATSLEDNIRNHLNLVERYSQQNLTQRAVIHSLHLQTVHKEEERNSTHRVATLDRQEVEKSINSRITEIRDNQTRMSRVDNFVQQYYQRERERLSHFLNISNGLSHALNRRMLSRFMTAREQEDPLDPLLVFGIVRQLRALNVPQYREFYLRTIRSWVQNQKTVEPIMKLAYAELLAQADQAGEARQVLKPVMEQIPNGWIFQNSVRFVQK